MNNTTFRIEQDTTHIMLTRHARVPCVSHSCEISLWTSPSISSWMSRKGSRMITNFVADAVSMHSARGCALCCGLIALIMCRQAPVGPQSLSYRSLSRMYHSQPKQSVDAFGHSVHVAT